MSLQDKINAAKDRGLNGDKKKKKDGVKISVNTTPFSKGGPTWKPVTIGKKAKPGK